MQMFSMDAISVSLEQETPTWWKNEGESMKEDRDVLKSHSRMRSSTCGSRQENLFISNVSSKNNKVFDDSIMAYFYAFQDAQSDKDVENLVGS